MKFLNIFNMDDDSSSVIYIVERFRNLELLI